MKKQMSNNITYYKNKLQFFQEGKEDGRIEPSAANKIIKMIQETINKIEEVYEACAAEKKELRVMTIEEVKEYMDKVFDDYLNSKIGQYTFIGKICKVRYMLDQLPQGGNNERKS